MKDLVEKMINVIEIVLMLSLVFHNIMILIIVLVKKVISGIHGTLMLGMILLMTKVTVV